MAIKEVDGFLQFEDGRLWQAFDKVNTAITSKLKKEKDFAAQIELFAPDGSKTSFWYVVTHSEKSGFGVSRKTQAEYDEWKKKKDSGGGSSGGNKKPEDWRKVARMIELPVVSADEFLQKDENWRHWEVFGKSASEATYDNGKGVRMVILVQKKSPVKSDAPAQTAQPAQTGAKQA